MTARIALFLSFIGFSSSSLAQKIDGTIPPRLVTDRIIVQYHPVPTYGNAMAFIKQGATNGAFGVAGGKERDILDLESSVKVEDAELLAKSLDIDPQVDFAEPDYIMQAMQIPNDARFNEQWNFTNSESGINAPAAWNITTGSPDIIVGVVDTGVVRHNDLVTNIVDGYDFISHPWIAKDGDGRDNEPKDPGDGITQIGACGTVKGVPVPSKPIESSWHGTHVAGTIAAVSNNNIGVSGVAWNSKIMPLRALGRCGGYMSDIVDAMLWAAGFKVFGLPLNKKPVKILNLSLGGSAKTCPKIYQNAIDKLTKANISIVVAAGNENRDASMATPANCKNVITVGSIDRQGNRSWYSNFGSHVNIAAPGGETLVLSNGILSTSNSGQYTANLDDYEYYQGTSMATPHVTGVLALMYSVNKLLTAVQAAKIIMESARAFPSGSCNHSLCGSGVLDAAAAVRAAQSK
ncbi:S8 family peptidase [Endozoicomonas montiporae]|uniref:Serine metalloprotease n=1 Tax=Endozoicomonas montiporae CL-33 TaxID=570277 RepID=A0A142B7R7_9GAMM|nr:S8 family peptidase [Endozoicomonas montiporae]AMO54793.1 serine metalloprotease [Endozoicomonas montiporae CL-33]